jgi:hypothetical protein
MTSRDEAFLMLNKWWDEGPLLAWSEVVSVNAAQGETISMARGAWKVRVCGVSAESVSVVFDGSAEAKEISVPLNSEFVYSDSRDSPFPDEPEGRYVCFLEIERPDGLLVVLAEMEYESES